MQKESASAANAEKPSSPGRGRFRAPLGGRNVASTTPSAPSNGAATPARPTFGKININRRRGRPTTAAAPTGDEHQETTHPEPGQTSAASAAPETATGAPKSTVRTRLPGTAAVRPAIRPGARVNLRQKPGQTTTTTTTTLAPEAGGEPSVEEPTGEGTEEETHEVSARLSIYFRLFFFFF